MENLEEIEFNILTWKEILDKPYTINGLTNILEIIFGNSYTYNNTILFKNEFICIANSDQIKGGLSNGNVIVVFPNDQVSFIIPKNIIDSNSSLSFFNNILNNTFKESSIKLKILINDSQFILGCDLIVLETMSVSSIILKDFNYREHEKTDLKRLFVELD